MSARHANVDGLLENLHEELSIEPSPDFEHRVRQRAVVRRADRSVVGLGGVVGLIGAATAIVVMSTISATSWVRHASTVVPSVSATIQADATVGPIAVPSRPSSNPLASVPQATGLTGATSSVVSAATGLEFEVLVPPDQAIALRRLLSAMASGRAVVPASTTIIAETGELLEPELIGITPLPDIAPLGWREGARGRER